MTEQIELSPRQENILKYIAECLEVESRPPTIREIGNQLNISSTSVVNYNLNRLKDKGLLERDAEVSRGLRLTDLGRDFLGYTKKVLSNTTENLNNFVAGLVRIPMMGVIKAGEPIDVNSDNFDVFDEDDAVEISSNMLPERPDKLFALRVNGDSMIDDMINDGDIVVMRSQEVANNGDMVAAWVEGEGTTLKRLYKEGPKIRLQPANPFMEPIVVNADDVLVQGKVMMVLRQTA